MGDDRGWRAWIPPARIPCTDRDEGTDVTTHDRAPLGPASATPDPTGHDGPRPPGETDLATMLAGLGATRRNGTFTYVAMAAPSARLQARAHAMVDEGHHVSLVVPVEVARDAGLPVPIELAWLTISVQSSLAAVGLTAAFSRMLGDLGIPCNVLAGHDHDHVLVPVDRVKEALAALTVQ